jgi:hypothetical protein
VFRKPSDGLLVQNSEKVWNQCCRILLPITTEIKNMLTKVFEPKTDQGIRELRICYITRVFVIYTPHLVLIRYPNGHAAIFGEITGTYKIFGRATS